MNLFKVYAAAAVFLVLCTYNAEGGIILLLLMKIIALKGALFFGMPLAIGSFMLGQGVGFFGGSLFGGYSMLQAAIKYRHKFLHKHKGWRPPPEVIHHYVSDPHHHHGHHHHHEPHGWGWSSPVVTTTGWKSEGPTYHSPVSYGGPPTHHHESSSGWSAGPPKPAYGPPVSSSGAWGGWSPIGASSEVKPSFLSSVRNRIFNLFGTGSGGKPRNPHHQGAGAQYGPAAAAGPSDWSGSYTPAASQVHGQDPMNTYYEMPATHDESGTSVVHHDHGAVGDASKYTTNGGYQETDTSSGTSTSEIDYSQAISNLMKLHAATGSPPATADTSYGVPAQETVAPEASYGSPAEGSYAHLAAGIQQMSDIYQSNDGGNGYQFTVQPEVGGEAAYGAPGAEVPQQPGVYDVNGQEPNLGAYSYYTEPSGTDGLLQGSEEVASKVKAPNSVIQSYLEGKLKEEMSKQKTAAQKKEAAELIAMLRQAYVQELVESLNGGGKKSKNSRADDGLPDFVPFPADYVPNSTTAKPKRVQLITLPNGEKRIVANGKRRRVSIKPSPIVKQFNTTKVNTSASEDEPTRFVPLESSTFVLEKRSGVAARRPSGHPQIDLNRSKRQAAELQALTTFADDIKKFFMLVSILDQDKCLQKLVCEVHTKNAEEVKKLTPYESNILVTFKVMNILLPADSEDSTTHYRAAAKIGELSKSAGICAKAYTSCTFSSTEIISMGNQVAASGDAETVSTTVKSAIAEAEAAQGSAPVPSLALPTAMPRV